jgi:hypothetical protein
MSMIFCLLGQVIGKTSVLDEIINSHASNGVEAFPSKDASQLLKLM